MLVEAVCMLGAWFDTPVAMEVSGTPELNDLDGWINIFNISLYSISNSSDQSPLVAFSSSESWSCVQLLGGGEKLWVMV